MSQRRCLGPKRPCTQPIRARSSELNLPSGRRYPLPSTAPSHILGLGTRSWQSFTLSAPRLTAAESEYSLQAATRGSYSSPWNLRTTNWRPRIASRRFQAFMMLRASACWSRVLSLTASVAVRSRLKDLLAENPGPAPQEVKK